MTSKKGCAVWGKWWQAPLSVIIACLSFGFGACTSIDCPVQNTVYAGYSLYTPGEQVDTLRDTMYVFAHRADGKDTLVFNAGIGLTAFQLPVSYSHPEDTLRFLFINGSDYAVLDTVWIKKEDIPHFESVDCSASFFHRLTAVRTSHNAIEALTINKDFVDYDAETPHFYISIKDRR